MFQDWKSKIKDNPQISPHLLWDIDKSKFDWEKMKLFIVQRVIERGDVDDFYAIHQVYGGPKGVRKIAKKITAVLDPRDEALMRTLFNLKKKDLKCYKHKRLKRKHWLS